MRHAARVTMVFAALLVFLAAETHAQHRFRSNGIGLRGTYWGASQGQHLRISNFNRLEVNTGIGGGGWIYFLARANETMMFEFAIGAIGVSVNEFVDHWENNVDVSGMVPIVLGIQQYFIPAYRRSSLQPYVAAGAGPYWLGDIRVRETPFSEEVVVDSELRPGAYLGGGLSFMLSSRFGLNFDIKYHIIDFDLDHERNGTEFGLGMQWMWGRSKNRRH